MEERRVEGGQAATQDEQDVGQHRRVVDRRVDEGILRIRVHGPVGGRESPVGEGPGPAPVHEQVAHRVGERRDAELKCGGKEENAIESLHGAARR
jgi:hypothetical protein